MYIIFRFFSFVQSTTKICIRVRIGLSQFFFRSSRTPNFNTMMPNESLIMVQWVTSHRTTRSSNHCPILPLSSMMNVLTSTVILSRLLVTLSVLNLVIASFQTSATVRRELIILMIVIIGKNWVCLSNANWSQRELQRELRIILRLRPFFVYCKFTCKWLIFYLILSTEVR